MPVQLRLTELQGNDVLGEGNAAAQGRGQEGARKNAGQGETGRDGRNQAGASTARVGALPSCWFAVLRREPEAPASL